ncbi:hypothetical protein, partial [Rhizobium ecuadorense]|uniref:hypothetical protein n=1 Tax=Rhizobium ecuadorense TaxID=1671795 RepID=UPI001AEBE021
AVGHRGEMPCGGSPHHAASDDDKPEIDCHIPPRFKVGYHGKRTDSHRKIAAREFRQDASGYAQSSIARTL